MEALLCVVPTVVGHMAEEEMPENHSEVPQPALLPASPGTGNVPEQSGILVSSSVSATLLCASISSSKTQACEFLNFKLL